MRPRLGSAAAAALAGLALGVALTVLAAGLTPAGVSGALRAYASLLRSPGVVVDVMPYFAAITLTA
ncbi:MAG: EamA family transporter, partial [Crenarchaeota archaeon]|nr:EamA family transporter [Thermoproteota archaeon]